MSERAEHWDRVYRERAADEVSWYQSQPRLSLRLVEATGVGRGEALIDVGGGASRLVDCLLQRDYRDLSVLDVSAEALAVARRRLGDTAAAVHWIHADVTGLAGDSTATIADAVWDEVITGAAHNTANSAGRRLRLVGESGGYSDSSICTP